MIRLYNLGDIGLNYFNNNYNLYYDYMESMNEYNVEIKNVYTFLPNKSSKINSVTEFKYGIIDGNIRLYRRMKKLFPMINGYSLTLYAVFSEFVEEYIKSNNNLNIYINEFTSTRSTIEKDISASKVEIEWNENYVFLNEQIAYYIKGSELDKYEVLDILKYAHGLWLPYDVGFISDYFPSRKNTTENDIKRLIQGIKLVFMGAYDGDGIIVGEVEEGDFISVFNKLNIPYTYEKIK